MVASVVVNYSLGQAGTDLTQVAPIIALSVALLVALVADLVTPRETAGRTVAAIAVLGYLVAGILAVTHWDGGGSAYHGFATGDHFARFFEILLSILGVLTVFVTHAYVTRRALPQSELHILLLAATTGMMALAAATSLVSIFISLELLSIALYVACGYDRGATSSQEAAVKYLMVGGFASAFLLYGMALVYGATGTTVLSQMSSRVATGNDALVALGVVMMSVGFAFKISGAPFHQWTPDVYQGAPLPVTAFMSVGTKAAAFAMIIRVFNGGLIHASADWQAALAVVAALSLVVGNLLAIVQSSVKRLLAYSSVSQAGYLLIGVLAGGRSGIAAVLFYLAAYTFTNFGAFALLTILSGPDGDLDRLENLDGIGRRNPWLGLLMTVFMLSLAGFPPTVGFIGKLWLFTAGVSAGFTWLVILAVIASAVSVYYYLKVLTHFWAAPAELPEAPSLSRPGILIVSGAGALALVLGILPYVLLAMGTSGAGSLVASR